MGEKKKQFPKNSLRKALPTPVSQYRKPYGLAKPKRYRICKEHFKLRRKTMSIILYIYIYNRKFALCR